MNAITEIVNMPIGKTKVKTKTEVKTFWRKTFKDKRGLYTVPLY